MSQRWISIGLATTFATTLPSGSAMAQQVRGAVGATDARITVGGPPLYARVIGNGQPLIVLHGGPDFDHKYLLPELDNLANAYRLIYYDQRGRGLSAERARPEDVTLASEVEDVTG
jgi:proline iminopeptidase